MTGYATRARHYASEIADLPEPRLLRQLLRPGLRVAEVPSGTGHFLPAYADASSDVTLIDACADMLAEAHRQGLQTRCRRVQDLTPDTAAVDLAIVPNAAFNQLAAQSGPGELLTTISQILVPDGLILLQVLLRNRDGTVGACTFFDPAVADGTWLTDRRFRDTDRRLLVRHRRQYADGGRLRLDFQLADGTDVLFAHSVDLHLFTGSELEHELARARLTLVDTDVGTGGLAEILARQGEGIR